jgi:2-keto-4-pentenoate hydratase/2-oxohepta-3-ene-1,7-dioic acid hydratase in catechol pathway
MYVSPQDGRPRAGLVVDDAIHGLEQGSSIIDLLGDDGTKLNEARDHAVANPTEVLAVSDVMLHAPIERPPSIRDSSSFEAHLRAGFAAQGVEWDDRWYDYPLFYFTNPNDVSGSGQDVHAAPGSQALDFELEVAAVIGREGTNLSEAEADDCIVGYCIFNDWSARDIQKAEFGFKVGPFKTKDWAMSAGPYLVTKDELEPLRKNAAYDLAMEASVNGRKISSGNLADIHWSFGELAAYSSRGTWLRTGDMIGSGTVGTGCILELSLVHGADEYPWLQPGDEIVLEVERLGRLANRVVDAWDVPDWKRLGAATTSAGRV